MSPKSNNYGIVYVLTNPAMSDMVKIGMTNRDILPLQGANLQTIFRTQPVGLG